MEINGVFQKGYISRQAYNTYRFSVRFGPLSPTELWGVPLHEFEKRWDEMMIYETLFPVHNMVSSFLRPYISHNQPRASFVYARSLLCDCPASLSAVTHEDHPDRDTWIMSYQE